MKEYMGVEYQIRSGGGNKWRWTIYPKNGLAGDADKGEVSGARSKAVDRAKEAIVLWLKKHPIDVERE